MARARNIAVNVARFKHKRAEHRSVLGLLCRLLLRNTLRLSCLVKQFSVFRSLVRGKRVYKRYAVKLHLGSDFFALGFVADKDYFSNSLFGNFCRRLDNALVLTLAKDYRFFAGSRL